VAEFLTISDAKKIVKLIPIDSLHHQIDQRNLKYETPQIITLKENKNQMEVEQTLT